jgi:hypothetical protein
MTRSIVLLIVVDVVVVDVVRLLNDTLLISIKNE